MAEIRCIRCRELTDTALLCDSMYVAVCSSCRFNLLPGDKIKVRMTINVSDRHRLVEQDPGPWDYE